MRRMLIAAAAVVAVVGLSACSSGQVKERNAVLEAQVADLSQQNGDLSTQLQSAQQESDRVTAQLAQQQTERDELAKRAEANAAAAAALARADAELASTKAREADLQAKLMSLATPPKSSPSTYAGSPRLEAFKRDLEMRLAKHHVKGVEVDVRTAQDGQPRVAVVLQNAFRAGSDKLTSNMTAVKAVVGVGKLISDAYPNSRVVVEGHTDSDKITKSHWESNDALSLARSEEVKRILKQSGVSEGRVTAVGMGARRPIARTTTPIAKAQNRRVEIYIYPTAD